MKLSNKGFTLIELLTVVLIIGILTSIALPNYSRSIERSRAVEAMAVIKSLNDATYAYYAAHQECPPSFSKLIVEMPGAGNSKTAVGKTFTYKLGENIGNAATNRIFGTSCASATAIRNAGDYKFRIWNPYQTGTGGKRSLACKGENEKSIGICDSLDLLEGTPPAGF